MLSCHSLELTLGLFKALKEQLKEVLLGGLGAEAFPEVLGLSLAAVPSPLLGYFCQVLFGGDKWGVCATLIGEASLCRVQT